MTSLNIEIEQSEDRTVIQLSGRLTFKENRNFTGFIDNLYSEKNCKSVCVFNLSGIEFIDSAGIGMLLIAKDRASNLNIEIILAQVPETANHIIQIARLDRVFTIE